MALGLHRPGCGYFWLLYALVRGLPRLRIGNSPQNSWLDLLPSLALLLLPILLCVFRQAMMPALTRWFNGLQRMPLSRKIGWVVAIALVILFLQTNNPLLAQREGLGLITPLLMSPSHLGWSGSARRPTAARLRTAKLLRQRVRQRQAEQACRQRNRRRSDALSAG